MIDILATAYIIIAFIVFLAWCALVNNISKMADPEDATLSVIVGTYIMGVVIGILWPLACITLIIDITLKVANRRQYD